MAEFTVTVEGTDYDVSAPDEKTAWKWANAEHKKAPTPLPERPADLRQPQELGLVDRALNKLPTSGPIADIGQYFGDAAAGASGLMRGAVNTAFPGAGSRIWPTLGARDGVARTVGELADPVALAIGGGVAKALPYVSGAGVKGLAQNLAGGAVTGGAIGGLSEKGDTATGAAVGAGAQVVLPPVLKFFGAAAGKVWDTLSGKYGAVNAKKILEQASGSDLAAIRYAMANAPADLTASQAAAPIGNDMISALGSHAARNDTTNFYQRKMAQQAQDRVDRLAMIAGGANQTKAQQGREAAQSELNRITTPMRETELSAANTAGTTGQRLQEEADALFDAAASKVADVRRIGKAGEIAESVGQSGRMRLDSGAPPAVGLSRAPAKYSYGTELSELADRMASAPAADSLLLGQGARFKQMQADSIAAHGLTPLKGSSIIRSLNAKIADPKIGSEIMKEKVLTAVRDRLQQWTNSEGIIDASAIYGIRKSAVNDTIEQLMGAADPKSKAKAAAGVLSEVRPLIDKAIEDAGGTGWRKYLNTFEQGMRQIEQKKLAAVALNELQKSPGKFESLVAGNEPKKVSKVFSTEYDIQKAMGDKFPALQGIASEVTRDRLIKEGGARGNTALQGILQDNYEKFHLPNWINRNIAITNRVLGEVETRVNKQTANALQNAMKSGKSFNEALSVLPAKDRISAIRILSKSMDNPYFRAGTLNSLLQDQQ